VNGLATGQRTDRAGVELAQQHATMQALMSAGVDPVIARAAAINPDYLKAIMAVRHRTGSTARASPGGTPSAGANAAEPPRGLPSNLSPSVAPPTQPLPRMATPTEAARLPSGTHFLDPQGVERVVP
jgi:hypothetical protein